MLNKNELKLLCNKLSIPNKGIELLENIRSSNPVRLVGGNTNVSGRYPSRKMGVTIQFESHKVELPAIYLMENDPSVLEYYDQPLKMKLKYKNSNGRNVGFYYTPDFLVIKDELICFEEWKTEDELLMLSEKDSSRYRKDSNGNWICPPASKWTEEYGISFFVRSSNEINWNLQRNMEYLEDFLLDNNFVVKPEIKDVVLNQVKINPGITLNNLFNSSPLFTPKEILKMIADKDIYIYAQ